MATISNRLNTLLLVLLVLMAGAIIAMLATRAYGGPLDPPGAPASTDAVRLPGTPISSLPFTISQSGNYYLTRSLTAPGPGTGISIAAANVTLDLQGFTLDGGNVGSLGVVSNSSESGITVRNGTAVGWTNAGFSGSFGLLEDVQANHNGGTGIAIDNGTLTRCAARANAATGIVARWSTVTDCTAIENATGMLLVASTLRGCATRNNTGVGVIANQSLVEDCMSFQDLVGISVGDAAYARGNTVTFSKLDGIQIPADTATSVVTENHVTRSGANGFGVGIAVIGIDNRVNKNTVTRNQGHGIYVEGSFNTIDDNTALENNGVGIDIVGGPKNTVVRNSSLGNLLSGVTTNYFIVAGNNPGTVIAANATSDWSNTQ